MPGRRTDVKRDKRCCERHLPCPVACTRKVTEVSLSVQGQWISSGGPGFPRADAAPRFPRTARRTYARHRQV